MNIVVFDGLGKGATFPTQVHNLNINRNAKDHLGTVGFLDSGFLGFRVFGFLGFWISGFRV